MIQKYKKMIVVTSIVTVCPMLLGLFWWNRMPDTVATHFGADNAANGWSSKPFAVIGIPLILLGLHLLCVFMTVHDPKKRNINGKMILVFLWIIPVLSLLCNVYIYCNAVGYSTDIGFMVNLVLGGIFLVLGNYLPKCKQNFTAGIRTAWTLSSAENWNRTHRLAGWIMALCGVLFLINAFVTWPYMLIAVIILALVPYVYSFLLYKKGV